MFDYPIELVSAEQLNVQAHFTQYLINNELVDRHGKRIANEATGATIGRLITPLGSSVGGIDATNP